MRHLWDPITNYSRDTHGLEAFLAFAILTAGRRNDRASNTLEALLVDCQEGTSPFAHIRKLVKAGSLTARIEATGLGYQAQKARGLASAASAGIDLHTATVNEIETAIAYVGPKTARFWAMHSRPNQRFAALDVHLLHFMRDYQDAFPTAGRPPLPIPERTPEGKTYKTLEALYLTICDKHGQDPAAFDYKVWEAYAAASRGDDTLRVSLFKRLSPKPRAKISGRPSLTAA